MSEARHSIERQLETLAAGAHAAARAVAGGAATAAERAAETVAADGTLFFCGNGGSAPMRSISPRSTS
jgi:phosphoheptose isomerase